MNAVLFPKRLGSTRATTVTRWVLGVIFVGTGALKAIDPTVFYSALQTYALPLPDVGLRLVAVTLPWLEMITGGLLLANAWVATASAGVAVQSFVFVVVLGQARWRGLELDCGCFGSWHAGWLDQPFDALGRAVLLLFFSLRLFRPQH